LSIVFWIISDLFHRPHVMELDTWSHSHANG
jgi:hypothetical protein